MARRIGLSPAIVTAARGRLGTQSADVSQFINRLHHELQDIEHERTALRQREQELSRERSRLELEGVKEQRAKVRELEQKLESVLKDFDYRARELMRGIEDRAAQQKVSKLAERRVAQMRREFSEEFKSAVVAHRTGADKQDPNARPHLVGNVAVGDTVKLRSLGKNAVIQRQIDPDTFEVAIGMMKMRARRDDIAQVVSRREEETPLQSARSRGINVRVAVEDAPAMELNVIGRTVDEATDELQKFLDRAFLAGVPQVRVVHGTGTGALRKALRAHLNRHPQVAFVAEAAQNAGGGGATGVDLKR
jgi:DNA mismatch repair protein MutS2